MITFNGLMVKIRVEFYDMITSNLLITGEHGLTRLFKRPRMLGEQWQGVATACSSRIRSRAEMLYAYQQDEVLELSLPRSSS